MEERREPVRSVQGKPSSLFVVEPASWSAAASRPRHQVVGGGFADGPEFEALIKLPGAGIGLQDLQAKGKRDGFCFGLKGADYDRSDAPTLEFRGNFDGGERQFVRAADYFQSPCVASVHDDYPGFSREKVASKPLLLFFVDPAMPGLFNVGPHRPLFEEPEKGVICMTRRSQLIGRRRHSIPAK